MADPVEDEIVLELEDDKPPETEIRVEDAPRIEVKPEAQKPVAPEEGLEALKQKLQAEKEGRLRAEREAHERAQEVHRAKNEVQDTNLSLVNNAIELVKQSSEGLKAQYREAAQSQDFDRMADLQMEMASKAADLKQLEAGKLALEQAPKAPAPTRQASDPVEDVASRLTPRSADWVRKHPEYATDQRLMQKMIAAHNLAVADGYAPDSDDYFSSVEDTLRIRRQEVQHQEPTQDAAQPSGGRRASGPPAAPVSRESPSSPQRPNVVRLTAAEREIAAMNNMTDAEYAKHKYQLIKEGKLH